MRALALIFALVSLSACSPKNTGGSSSLTIALPTAEQLRASDTKASAQKITSSNLDFAKACFMVNITGEGIVDNAKSKCDVPSGIFAGSAAPGGKLEIEILKGPQRKIEVLAYFRNSTSELCLKKESVNQFNPGSTAIVGTRTVDLSQDRETVDIDISLPAAGTTLVTQAGLPAFCEAGATTLGGGSARIVSARQSASTTNFKVESVITGLATGPKLKTGSGRISVRFSHMAKDKDTQ